MSDRPSSAAPSEIVAALAEASGGRANAARLIDGILTVVLDVAGLDKAARGALEAAARNAVDGRPDVAEVRVAMTAERVAEEPGAPRFLAVGSGKGGVGKSTVAVNLAVALARRGLRVGLVDADIHGPSLPRLLSSEGVRPRATDSRMIPVDNAYGVPMLSMGHLVEPGRAIAWRGPMAANALGQLLGARWEGFDIVVVDLPPGTGDVQLSMLAKHRPAGAIVVSTPQDLALLDAARAIDLFRQAGVPILGLVENMAGYACPHCGETSDPFGRGGVEAAAHALSLDLLGRVPLAIAVREASDAGVPPAAGDGPDAAPFAAIAATVAVRLER